jgi:cell division protein FtsB
MKNYVSTLETKVKSQDEKINKLKKSNEELSNSNRMMNSRIDSLEKDLESNPSVPCILSEFMGTL